jgi:hypothetical protein
MSTIEAPEMYREVPAYLGVSRCEPEGPVALTPEQTALIARSQEDEQLSGFLELVALHPKSAARLLLDLDEKTRMEYLDAAGKLLDESVANRFAGKYFKAPYQRDGENILIDTTGAVISDTAEVDDKEGKDDLLLRMYTFVASSLLCGTEVAKNKIAEQVESAALPEKLATSLQNALRRALLANGPIQLGGAWGVIDTASKPDRDDSDEDLTIYQPTTGEDSPLGVDNVLTYEQMENGQVVATSKEVYLVTYEEALAIFGRVYGTGLFFKLMPELLFDNEQLARLATEIHCAVLQPLEDFGLERIRELLREHPSFVETMEVVDKKTGESRLDTAIKRVAIADYRQGENTRTDRHWQKLIDKAGLPARMKMPAINAVHQFIKEIKKAKETHNA